MNEQKKNVPTEFFGVFSSKVNEIQKIYVSMELLSNLMFLYLQRNKNYAFMLKQIPYFITHSQTVSFQTNDTTRRTVVRDRTEVWMAEDTQFTLRAFIPFIPLLF